MFSHIMVGANDIEESKLFYDKVLGVLGSAPGALTVNPTGHKRYMYVVGEIMFLISEPIDDNPASHGNGGTIGFNADSPETADAWHEAGVNSGGTTCEDLPGVREGDGMKFYLAYLRDPSGNKLCALHNMQS